ncbi:DMT family transporter [Marinomonas sp. C2222]|uniref:DMT family transporter n=1 Tax=Marinomonas sargassi TaxID=2984494 RepID=A0ABT2YU72_9GAMM|nr:DMT family transporter [Marinomonas sargassi]MCV2403435.1 DMT family transporter [Marinomonas sargassi]
MNIFPFLAVSAGVIIAVQGTLNAQLGFLLKNPLLGTSIAFLVAFLCMFSTFLVSVHRWPTFNEVFSVPAYLLFSGGILCAVGIGTMYYLIPKMGVGTLMSYSLCGQLIMAVVASHFGWFDLPQKPIDGIKSLGVMALIIGVVLLNSGVGHDH